MRELQTSPFCRGGRRYIYCSGWAGIICIDHTEQFFTGDVCIDPVVSSFSDYDHRMPACKFQSLQSCLTLWSHGLLLQARILEWVAIPSSRGSSQPRDWTCISLSLLHWQAGSLSLAPPGNIKSKLIIKESLYKILSTILGVFFKPFYILIWPTLNN